VKPVSASRPFDVLDAVAAPQVQKDHRQHRLNIQPALGTRHANMPADRRAEATGVDQIEIHWRPSQRGQADA